MSSPFQPETPIPASNYRAMVKNISPPWLAGNSGYRLMYSLAIQLDAIAEYLRLGCLQRFPAYCEVEALPHLGLDRRMIRGPNEAAAAFRERLLAWKTTWKYAGNAVTLLRQLAAYFSPSPPTIRYVSNGYDDAGNTVADWWTLDSAGNLSYQRATPANFDWDGSFGNYRFWIIVYAPLLAQWTWDEPGIKWDAPGLLWGYKGGQDVLAIHNIIQTFKAAGTHCKAIIYSPANTARYVRWGEFTWTSGTFWDQSLPYPSLDPLNPPGQPMPDGTWGDSRNRDPNLQYFYEDLT